jgi:hypothetical protein
MAHSLAGIGFGYAWPKLKIVGDGQSTTLAMFPGGSDWEPIHYLERFELCLSAKTFEASILNFLRKVETRLREQQVEVAGFSSTLRRLEEERADPEIVQWRKLEAFLGHDPDEADDALIEKLYAFSDVFGVGIMNEMVAAFGAGAPTTFDQIDKLKTEAVEACFPDELKVSNDTAAPATEAWVKGEAAAKCLLEKLAFNGSVVSNCKLGEILSVQPAYFDSNSYGNGPLSAAFSGSSQNLEKLYLGKKWHTGRRFDAARLIGDFQLRTMEETVLPATAATTYRQKYQRAFAREFLLPTEVLKEFWKDHGTDDDAIEAIADDFEVSPRLVESTLINKGLAEQR